MYFMMKAIIAVLLPVWVTCWWDVGHMLSAAIAENRLNQLNPYASAKFRELVGSINNLVDNRSRTFIESACWPDDLKGRQYNMELWNSWHFIDKPYVQDGTFPVINYTETTLHSVNVVNSAIKAIASNINSTTAERALFARYLVHVVGDIHQPLHSVALYNATFPSGDRGGNSLHIKLGNGTTQNLHAFWDAGGFGIQNDTWFMTRPLDIQNLTALKAVANDMIKQYGPQVEALAQELDPSVWAMESFRIAQNTTYPPMFTTNEISPEYQKATETACKKRVTLAGYRLANLVIDIYERNTRELDVEQAWQQMLADHRQIYQEQ